MWLGVAGCGCGVSWCASGVVALWLGCGAVWCGSGVAGWCGSAVGCG